MEHYKNYLLGWWLRVTPTTRALMWLLSLKEPKHRVARWIKALSKFDFEVEYWPDKKYGNADTLSQDPNPRDCCCPQAEEGRLCCKACKKFLVWTKLIWGEIWGVPTTIQVQPHAGRSQALRIVTRGADPLGQENPCPWVQYLVKE